MVQTGKGETHPASAASAERQHHQTQVSDQHGILDPEVHLPSDMACRKLIDRKNVRNRVTMRIFGIYDRIACPLGGYRADIASSSRHIQNEFLRATVS